MIKRELREFIFYNEIISNIVLSSLVFMVVTFGVCISLPSFFAGFTFTGLTIFDILKR